MKTWGGVLSDTIITTPSAVNTPVTINLGFKPKNIFFFWGISGTTVLETYNIEGTDTRSYMLSSQTTWINDNAPVCTIINITDTGFTYSLKSSATSYVNKNIHCIATDY